MDDTYSRIDLNERKSDGVFESDTFRRVGRLNENIVNIKKLVLNEFCYFNYFLVASDRSLPFAKYF